jgi:large subunit ribosomal protein L16
MPSPKLNLKYKKLHVKRNYKGNDWYRPTRKLKKSGVIISKSYGKLGKEEIEAARRIIRNKALKKGRLLIRVKSNIFLTKKPAQVRMGKGKGRIFSYVAFVRPGKVLFELQGLNKKNTDRALISGSKKLSLPVVVRYWRSVYK